MPLSDRKQSIVIFPIFQMLVTFSRRVNVQLNRQTVYRERLLRFTSALPENLVEQGGSVSLARLIGAARELFRSEHRLWASALVNGVVGNLFKNVYQIVCERFY